MAPPPKEEEPWTFVFIYGGRYSQPSITLIQRKVNQLTKEARCLTRDAEHTFLHQAPAFWACDARCDLGSLDYLKILRRANKSLKKHQT